MRADSEALALAEPPPDTVAMLTSEVFDLKPT